MRPALLNPLFSSISRLKGVGTALEQTLTKLTGGGAILDLVWHLPAQIVQRPRIPYIDPSYTNKTPTLLLKILKHTQSARPSQPYRVQASDGVLEVDLVFFNVKGDYLTRLLPVGAEKLISGKLEKYQHGWQIVHPDYIERPENKSAIPEISPVYPLTATIPNKTLARIIVSALPLLPELPEWLDESVIDKMQWPSWRDALTGVHQPQKEMDSLPGGLNRTRLAYDELLANQLALALIRRRETLGKGQAVAMNNAQRQKALSVLPFELTDAQKRSLSEIDQDMASNERMLRLLQGDVGSGKTVVAFLAALNAIAAGAQAAIMAPTEILARQHEETISALAEKLNIKVATLTGRDSGKARDEILKSIADGSAQIIIGTHSLIQEDVAFHNLALAVIDEQHRFGVDHRLALSGKGKGCNILVMTATPIPRTLTLTTYGDMEISLLSEKPPGRQKIATRILSLDKMDEVVEGLKRHIQNGAQIYWVCPLVEESEKLDLAAAEKRYESLQFFFGEHVGLLHGRMKPKDKDRVMEEFSSGKIKILVSTTVIEVGINVPSATVMIIEHAERFGLAQLHQLRGRVGRGAAQSHCLLLYSKPLNEVARARLSIMRDTDDGFRIAEEDLRLRGGGELLGTRQSGLPEFRLVDLSVHADLVPMARDDAKLILSRDPELQSERGQALKILLYLFQRNEAVRYLRSG